jgi:hypothetical protein
MLILPLSTPSSGGGLPPGVTSPGDGALNYVTGALTASRPSINVAQTWNNAAEAFDADLVDVTDTASAAGSTLLNRKVGGVSIFQVQKSSHIRIGGAWNDFAIFVPNGGGSRAFSVVEGASTRTLEVGQSGITGLARIALGAATNNPDALLWRGGPNIWEQRNAGNAQTFRLYNNYLDPSNYERGFMRWNANVLQVGAEAAGTGTVREVHLIGASAQITAVNQVYISTTGSVRWGFNWSGSGNEFAPNSNNAFDIGLASNRIRDLFMGRQLNISGSTITADTPALNISQTWNNAAVTFTGMKFNVTDTASNASSLLAEWQVGGTSRFKIQKDGSVTAAGTISGTTLASSAAVIGSILLGMTEVRVGSSNTVLREDAANTLAQRNGTAAQTYRLERAYVDGSNRGYTDFAQDAAGGVRLNSVWTGSVAAPTALLDVQANGASNFTVSTSGISNAGSKGALLGGVYLNYGAGQSVIGWPGSPSWGGVLGLNMYTNGTSNGMVSWNGDAAIVRNAAGVLEVNSGTFGQFRDLKLRALFLADSTAPGTLVQWQYAGYGLGSNANGDTVVNVNSAPKMVVGAASMRLASSVALMWGTGADLLSAPSLALYRGADNVISQRNGLNPQAYELFNSYTDPSNHEKTAFKWASNEFIMELGRGFGSGVSRTASMWFFGSGGLQISPYGSAAWRFAINGMLCAPDQSATAVGFKRSATTMQIRLGDDSDFTALQAKLMTHAAAASGTITPTHTMTLFDAAGVAYKVPCVAA